MIEAKDYHKVLGVPKGAGLKEIREAYRRLALQFHPDRNNDAGAEERFKEISEAYAVLSGKEKPRAEAPVVRSRGGGGAGGIGDADAWAFHVSMVWKNIEEERHNNMYR